MELAHRDPKLAGSEGQDIREEAIDLNEQPEDEGGEQDERHRSRGQKLGEISHTYLSSVEFRNGVSKTELKLLSGEKWAQPLQELEFRHWQFP
jgi:hypothetical protein